MNESPTQSLPNDGNILNLILARLDSIDSRLDRMEMRLDRVEARLDAIETRLDKVEARLDRVEARLDEMDTRLETLEARAYDTKPIWERALAELIGLGKRIDSLDRRFSVLNDDVIQSRADYRRLDERVTHLEQPRA